MRPADQPWRLWCGCLQLVITIVVGGGICGGLEQQAQVGGNILYLFVYQVARRV
jgi:hypothetical protein